MASKKFSPEKVHEFKEAFALFDKNGLVCFYLFIANGFFCVGDGQITVSELAAVMK